MKQSYFIVLLLCVFNFALGSDMTPNFAISATISGGATFCQNSSSVVTFEGSGGTAPYTFSYKINGGAVLTVSSTGTNSTVNLPVNSSVAGDFTYTLVSVSDSANPNVVESVNGNTVFNIIPLPNANMGGTGAGSVFDNFAVFRVCSNNSSVSNFTNTSTTIGTNASYTIDWGDDTPNFTGTNWNTLSHTYSVGLKYLTYSITGNNGCVVTKTYIVFVGSNPAVALGNPGNTDICNSEALTFPITGTSSNPPGTTYKVTFNDGSAPQVFNHPPPAFVTHTFLTSSCGVNSSDGSNTYPNSFSVNIVASNPCSTSSVGVVPIYVSENPLANFNSPTNACLNNQICLTNTSLGNQVISNTCSSPSIIWEVSPSTGFSLNSNSSLGNDFSSDDTSLWLSGSNNLCLTFTIPGTYTITLKTGNKCGVDIKTKTICVQPQIVPNFTLSTVSGCSPLAVTTTNTTNLTNFCNAPTYNWIVAYASGNCGTTSAYTYTNGTSATSASPSFNFTGAGTYTISLKTTNSCAPETSLVQTVVVKKPPTVSIATITNACGSTTITPSATVANCTSTPGSVTYAWSFPGGNPSTANTLNPGSISYANSGAYTVSLIVTNECGNSNTASQTFTINPSPTITNTDLSQSICSGTATVPVTFGANPAGTTFSWTATATLGISGFTASGTTATIPAQTISTTNSNPGTVTYVITPKNGNCTGLPVNYVVNVIPAPVISSQPASSTVCLNGVATPLTVVVNASSGAPTYQWYSNSSNSTIGGTLIPGATSATYVPPTDVTGTVYYYCIISLSSAGCSNLTSNIASVKVVPLPSISAQPLASQNLCVGVAIANPLTVSYLNGNGSVTYQWYSNTTNATTGGTLIPGATNQSYSPGVFSIAGNFYYYVTITFSGNNCGIVTSETAVINVFADPTLSTQPIADQTLCQNASPEILEVVATGGTGTFTYQWYFNTVNTTSGTAIAGATNATYTPPTNTVGTRYYYCIVSQDTLGCLVTSTISKVVVNQSPSVGNQPVPSTVCVGGTPSALTFTTVNGTGTPTYQWYSNTENNTTTGTAIAGATNATFTPPAAIIGTLYYYCLINFPAITGSCATIATNTAKVEVITGVSIDQNPLASQNLCVGSTIATPLTVSFSGGTGTPSYQWFSNTTNSNNGGTPISGATAATFTPAVFTAVGTFYYYVNITFTGSGCGFISSNVAAIEIIADPVVSSQPLDSQTLCQNAVPTSLSVEATGGIGTTFNYQWFSSTTNSNSGGILIPGATNAAFVPTTATVGTIYYYCLITQASGSGCDVTSSISKVVVNQSPSVGNQPVPSTVCVGGTPSALTFTTVNGTGTPTYQWYSNTENNTTTGTAIAGATNATFTPPADVIGTLYYYCLINFPAITGSCATIATNTAKVEVITGVSMDQNPLASQNLCVGSTIATPLTVSFSGGTGTPSYQWFSNITNSNTGGTPISGATAATFTPAVFTAVGTFYYYVNITFTGSGCGFISSDVAAIEIIADPVISSQPLDSQTLCQNAVPTSLSVEATGGIGATYNYQWYSSTTNSNSGGTLIPGAINATFVPTTATVGTIYYYCLITQASGSGCDVTSNTATVIINLSPTINAQPLSNSYCLNQVASNLSVTYANGTGTPTYQWYSNSVNDNTTGTAIIGATNATYVPPTNTVGTIYYYSSITFPSLSGGCEIITSNTALITVNPFPIVGAETATICSNNSFAIIPLNGNGNSIPAGTTYTWTLPVVNPVGAISGFSAQSTPQTEISQNLLNNTTNPATVTYTVTPTSGICTGDSFTVIITVNPAINPNIMVTNNTCFGVSNASIATNISGGIAPYTITWTGPNGFTSASSTISNLEPGNYTILIEDTGNCPFTNSYTITQPDDILISVNSQNNSSCFQSNNGAIDISVSGGTGAYSYNWTKNNLPFSTTQDLENLSPGEYIVNVTDENNCGPKTLSFTITEPPLVVISVLNQTNISCFGASTGSINVEVIGGTIATDYNFSWTGPNGFASANQNLTGLFAGTYHLVVTDDNGCQKTTTVTLTESTPIILTYTTTAITCYGANDASFNATISGGNAPYQFTWSNLSTVLNQNNLAAGNYTITITDNLGCVKSETINIPEAPIFMVNPIVKNVTCFGANNGSIQLNLIGGIAPVTLTWNDGSTAGLTRNNLPPGTYTATISDGTPCHIVRTFTIVEPQSLVASANIINPTDCNNGSSGTIDLIVSGGTPPFAYSWSNGANTQDLNNVVAGNYSVTVTDSNGCTTSAQFSLTRPQPLSINVTTETNFNCDLKEVTQNFVAQASGGVPPYQYHWASGNVSGPNNEIMTTDLNGTVILTVEDYIGCTQIYTVEVNNIEIGDIAFEPISIGSTSYGMYAIEDPIQFNSTITGDYESFFWDFGDGTTSTELNPIHTYLIPKDYVATLTVTYPFGCVYKFVVTLSVEKGYVLVVPTAFTPNNDGLNETFRPVTKNLKNVTLDIYDSWGSLIYSEKGDVIKGWDAKIKGFNAENGNYYGKVSGETFYGTFVYDNQTFVLIK